jgi:hypothetical protein
VKLAYAEPTGIIDLNIASVSLGVKMRRIYEVVNVLEGIGLVKKTGVTRSPDMQGALPGWTAYQTRGP